MKKILAVALMLIAGLILTTDAHARRGAGMMWGGSGGWGSNAPYCGLYNAKATETLSGEVVSVERFTPSKGMGHGVHITLKTDKETIPVHLGPLWFVEKQDIKIEANDKVEVKGARITFNDKPAIIAATVKKGDMTLVLRDETGIPVWAGWRKR